MKIDKHQLAKAFNSTYIPTNTCTDADELVCHQMSYEARYTTVISIILTLRFMMERYKELTRANIVHLIRSEKSG